MSNKRTKKKARNKQTLFGGLKSGSDVYELSFSAAVLPIPMLLWCPECGERHIDVAVGVERERCRELNRGFFSRVERGRPYTTLKLAGSLDGRVATRRANAWTDGRRFARRL